VRLAIGAGALAACGALAGLGLYLRARRRRNRPGNPLRRTVRRFAGLAEGVEPQQVTISGAGLLALLVLASLVRRVVRRPQSNSQRKQRRTGRATRGKLG
jgi:HAMP domain-containing protein